jgi:Arm DNA-binding domain
MPGQQKRLTTKSADAKIEPGRYADGNNLYLRVIKTPAGVLSKSWVYMYEFRGKQREIGLGSFAVVALAQARQLAVENRTKLTMGIDPLETKREERRRGVPKTFGEVAADVLKARRKSWHGAHHANE